MTTRRSFLKSLAGVVASLALAQRMVLDSLNVQPVEISAAYAEELSARWADWWKEQMRKEYERLATGHRIVSPT